MFHDDSCDVGKKQTTRSYLGWDHTSREVTGVFGAYCPEYSLSVGTMPIFVLDLHFGPN